MADTLFDLEPAPAPEPERELGADARRTIRLRDADDWGVFVNECGIFASGIARDRWIDFTLKAKDGRLTMLRVWPGGGEWHVMCGTKEDAAEALETFLGVGFHKAHVKVARLSSCVAKVAERRRLVRERMAVHRDEETGRG